MRINTCETFNDILHDLLHVQVHIHTHSNSSYMTLIGVRKMHGQVQDYVTDSFVHDPVPPFHHQATCIYTL